MRASRQRLAFAGAVCLVLGFVLGVPVVRFNDPVSTVLLDRDGRLLGATIAADEQWRFPPLSRAPDKYVAAVTAFEDRRFHWHPGVDPLALARAARQNLGAGRVVSGASTLTMQVVRLARRGQPRSFYEKIVEAIWAVRLELALSKDQILALYAAHAPFGGNVVGLDAAAWRYFGRSADALSWAEAATLAVLPNSPALVHPGRSRGELLRKRNALLDTLEERSVLDAAACALAKEEPLPGAPLPMPQLAPHLLARAAGDVGKAHTRVRSSLDWQLQGRVTEVVERHHAYWAGNGVHNAAAVVLDIGSGDALAYVGNVRADGDRGQHVDIVRAPRSTGSLLKPFLYAALLQEGDLLPDELVADVPTRVGGFSPVNFSGTYAGAVPASQALARSLNVPAVRLLQQFGVDRFYATLKELGLTTLWRPAADYGLSLVLGGAEGTLWDLTNMYAGLVRRARGGGEPIDAGAAYLTLQALRDVRRPETEAGWQRFVSAREVSWKTGTSFGFRDAWAVGVTSTHAVGVWVGNASGEGRPGLTGHRAAAPVLFEIIKLLDAGPSLRAPAHDLVSIEVCAHSGMRAGPSCARRATIAAPRSSHNAPPCAYCQTVHCDAGCAQRVHSGCAPVAHIRLEPRFVLPADMERYFVKEHLGYRPLPPWREDCRQAGAQAHNPAMACLYPKEGSILYVPLELDGQRGRTVFEAAHRDADARIYWHLDDTYVGDTFDIHQLALAPTEGAHTLTLVDEHGETLVRRFSVLAKN